MKTPFVLENTTLNDFIDRCKRVITSCQSQTQIISGQNYLKLALKNIEKTFNKNDQEIAIKFKKYTLDTIKTILKGDLD